MDIPPNPNGNAPAARGGGSFSSLLFFALVIYLMSGSGEDPFAQNRLRMIFHVDHERFLKTFPLR